jgi:hypothetical protein
MQRLAALLAAVIGLAACQRAHDGAQWLGPVRPVATPTGVGSRFPNLASASGGDVVMSWLDPVADGGFFLRHAKWVDGRWSPPRTVRASLDWFVNWADFPSVVPIAGSLWAAHWLQQRPGNVYSYDVRLAVSRDGGTTWSTPISPHDDGTPTEHGFVSMFRDGPQALRAVWLDGRDTQSEQADASVAGGAMALRTAVIDAAGRRMGIDSDIDARVCDCCQTDAVLTADGPVVAYRDRSTDETRNIVVVRHDGVRWSVPVPVHDDGWRIAGCPVNGPAIDAVGNQVAIAWFTAPDKPRIRLAFSADGGRSFAPAIEVAAGPVAGRVDVVLMPDRRAIVSWLAEGRGGARIMAQPFTVRGADAAPVAIARLAAGRQSGFPQMARIDDGLLFAWTEPGDEGSVRSAFAPLR